MKKVTCKSLFWFCIKHYGKFEKSILVIIVISLAVVAVSMAHDMVTDIYDHYNSVYSLESRYNRMISENILYHNQEFGKGFIYNTKTGKKTLKGISWIREPICVGDTLASFLKDGKWGYFSLNTGEVIIPATKFIDAWPFSDGVACVQEDSLLLFIDTKGQPIFNRTFVLNEERGYFFVEGFCAVDSNSDHLFGLINKNGETVMEENWTEIVNSDDNLYWILTKDNQSCVLDMNLDTIIPLLEAEFCLNDDCIVAEMPDNTICRYSYDGTLLGDGYVTDFEPLMYEDSIHAHLYMYEAANDMEGLMTITGKAVTQPIYSNIEAVGPDSYLCSFEDGYKEVLDGNALTEK